MLISRALNRGYAMSRYRWPVHFGLLNNDCLWVLDETQLMGVGLTTTAQLQGLRQRFGTYGKCQSLWMSATLDDRPLHTIDHKPDNGEFQSLTIDDEDRRHALVARRLTARKRLQRATVALTKDDESAYAGSLAAAVIDEHRKNSLSLVVLNQVDRAQSVYLAARKQLAKHDDAPALALMHSRFRTGDRSRHENCLFGIGDGDFQDRIVISTQAIEAGVDVSATTLWSELAPWPSLVQRFGRLNRYGEISQDSPARAYWIDIESVDDKGKPITRHVAPYDADELDRARGRLSELQEAGPNALQQVAYDPPLETVHTLRAKDVLELWDTTSDLSGADLDISRFIRDSTDDDVHVYWRDWQHEASGPPQDARDLRGWRPAREELCRVSIGRIRDFLKKLKNHEARHAWRWEPLEPAETRWQPAGPGDVRPGMVLLLHVSAGGYQHDIGWTGDTRLKEPVLEVQQAVTDAQADHEVMSDDAESQVGRFVSLVQHVDDVARHMAIIAHELAPLDAAVPWSSLHKAAQWHDVGKTHEAFQNMLLNGEFELAGDGPWAKSPGTTGPAKYYVIEPQHAGDEAPQRLPRRGFRHELASAIAFLTHRNTDDDADLVAYLIAAHHGKVRASIRSLPNESRPPRHLGERLFARGIWQGDVLPPCDLPDGTHVPATELDLAIMQLGSTSANDESWLSRTIRLRDDPRFGPFRLALLETLLRIADWRASDEESSAADDARTTPR